MLIEGGNLVGQSGVIEGAQTRMSRRRAVITSAQLLALNATPQPVVPAPGANLANIFRGMTIRKPAGTAYAGVAVGEDLSVKYTDGSGTELAACESTGFLDQTTEQIRYVRPHAPDGAGVNSAFTPVANAALVLHLLVGEITTGDSDLECEVQYDVVKAVP